MEPRRTGLSLLITGVIMLALGVLGAVNRDGRRLNGMAESSGSLLAAGSTSLPSDAEPSAHPLYRPPVAEWDVLTGCELADNKTNAAHHFHVRRGDDVFVFHLYFTAAPEVTTAKPDQVTAQARYFGLAEHLPENQWDKTLGHLGNEAWGYVAHLLQQRPFFVFTKWEKRPETHHYYAFVYLEDEDGEKRFLQELLAARGLAVITEPSLERLPDGSAAAAFLERLENLQRQAQQENAGAWAAFRPAR
jgi:hypothetical protein